MSITDTIDINRRPVIDLNLRHFETTIGNICVIGTWIMDDKTRRNQPALALIDATRKMRRGRIVPCIIPLGQAWRWTVEIGDPEHVWPLIRKWLRDGALPGNPLNNRDLWAVFDAVQSRLRDLIFMPHLPAIGALKYGSAPEQLGVLTIRNERSGKVLDQIKVTGNARN